MIAHDEGALLYYGTAVHYHYKECSFGGQIHAFIFWYLKKVGQCPQKGIYPLWCMYCKQHKGHPCFSPFPQKVLGYKKAYARITTKNPTYCCSFLGLRKILCSSANNIGLCCCAMILSYLNWCAGIFHRGTAARLRSPTGVPAS